MSCNKCNSHHHNHKGCHECNSCDNCHEYDEYLSNKRIVNSELGCGVSLTEHVVIGKNVATINGKIVTSDVHALDCIATCEDIVRAKEYTDLKFNSVSVGGNNYQLKNLQDVVLAKDSKVATQVDIDGAKAYTDLKFSQVSTGGGSTYVLNNTANVPLASGSKVLTESDATKVLNDAKAYTDSKVLGLNNYQLKNLQDVNIASGGKVATQVDLDSTLANAKAYTDSKTFVKVRPPYIGEAVNPVFDIFDGVNKVGITAPYKEQTFNVPANCVGVFANFTGINARFGTNNLITVEPSIFGFLISQLTNTNGAGSHDRVCFITNGSLSSNTQGVYALLNGKKIYQFNDEQTLGNFAGTKYYAGADEVSVEGVNVKGLSHFIPFKKKSDGTKYLEIGVSMPNNDYFKLPLDYNGQQYLQQHTATTLMFAYEN